MWSPAVESYAAAAREQSVVEFSLNVNPSTFIGAFAAGDILQVLLIALLFGFALHALGERARALRSLIDDISAALFRIVAIIKWPVMVSRPSSSQNGAARSMMKRVGNI